MRGLLIAGLLLLPTNCAVGTAVVTAIIDCTGKDLSGLESVASALVGELTGAPDSTWASVTSKLEGAGSTIGACVAGDLLDIATAPKGSLYTDAVDVAKCRAMMTTIKTDLRLGSTTIKTRHGVY